MSGGVAPATPGPWEIKEFGGPQISGPDGYAVATMWGALSVDELKGQDLANARLIAAAPDLVEALEKALKYLDGSNPLNVSGGYRNCDLRDDLRAALAKAREGGQA